MISTIKHPSQIIACSPIRVLLFSAMLGLASCTRTPAEPISQYTQAPKETAPQTPVNGITSCVITNGSGSTDENTNFNVTLSGPRLPSEAIFVVFPDRRHQRNHSGRSFSVSARGDVILSLPPDLTQHVHDPYFSVGVFGPEQNIPHASPDGLTRTKIIRCTLNISSPGPTL